MAHLFVTPAPRLLAHLITALFAHSVAKDTTTLLQITLARLVAISSAKIAQPEHQITVLPVLTAIMHARDYAFPAKQRTVVSASAMDMIVRMQPVIYATMAHT